MSAHYQVAMLRSHGANAGVGADVESILRARAGAGAQ